MAFGVFFGHRLKGALALGVGPVNAFKLVEGARPEDCLTLARFWMADELPKNGESRAIGVVLRALRRHTELKFLVTYADPAQGHQGTVYMASNWAYTGLSQATPLLDLGVGVARHSRTVSQAYGTHSLRRLARDGSNVRLVPQAAKHRYLYVLDPTWHERLRVPVLPYPKEE